MRNRIGIVGATFYVISTMAVMARADDEKISVESLPAAIKKAIKKKFHKAEIEKAAKEVEDGKTTYEVLLEIDDSPVDVAFKADGTILEIEKIEAVTKGEDGPTVYEIAIKTEVVLDAKGKFVGTTEEDDEKSSAKAKKPKKHDDDEDDEKGEEGEKGKKGHKD